MGKSSPAHGPLPLPQPELIKARTSTVHEENFCAPDQMGQAHPHPEHTFCGSSVQAALAPLASAITDHVAADGTSSPQDQEPRGLGVIAANP